MKYQKILIIGGIGAGKTTLAEKISKLLKIKNYEMDDLVHKRRDIHIHHTPFMRDKKLKLILKRKTWILEGFYDHPWTYPIYKKVDLIIILDIKISIAKKRIITRYLKRKVFQNKNKNINKQFKTVLKLLKKISKNSEFIKIQKELVKKYNKDSIILNTKKKITKFLNEIK